jgi:hypothetical protein
MANERGLVISRPIEISGSTLRTGPVDLQELRFSLLFWDKVDFPTNNNFATDLGAEGTFLENAGILNRTHVWVVGGGELAAQFRAAHVAAFRELDKKEPGVWSLATGTNALSFLDADLEPQRGVLLSLHRAIVVPDKDVPLQDVLEFRNKRHDELIALRHHLEDIYERVITAGDGALSLNKETERLEKAIVDHMKASRESGLKFRLVDFDANLNLVSLGAAIIASSSGTSLFDAVIRGGLAALAVKIGPSLKRREKTATPFKYVSYYHKELFHQ